MTQTLPIVHPIEPRAGGTVLLLTLMMFLVPALGASSLELLQDTPWLERPRRAWGAAVWATDAKGCSRTERGSEGD